MPTDDDPSNRVVVVMPAYNEATCITSFLLDVHRSLQQWSPSFVVVDDASSDNTADVVHRLAASDMRITIIRNDENIGHGASTLRALHEGLADGADCVLAVDGDGQFESDDLARVVATAFLGDYDVVEGVREVRRAPFYRRSVSGATRLLVWVSCGQLPTDANTPVRAYRPDALGQLLDIVGPHASIPNLLVSGLSRRLDLRMTEVSVRTTEREGSDPAGTTWRARWANIPSRRFVAFCWRAVNEWVRFVHATRSVGPSVQTRSPSSPPTEELSVDPASR